LTSRCQTEHGRTSQQKFAQFRSPEYWSERGWNVPVAVPRCALTVLFNHSVQRRHRTMSSRPCTSGDAPTTTKIVASVMGGVRAARSRRRGSRSNGMSESATRSQRQSGGFSVPSATGVRIGNIVFIGVLQCARSCATIDFVDRGNAEGAVDLINKSVGDAVYNRPDRHRICAQIVQRHAADQCAVGEFEPATATSRRRWRGQVATGDAQQHSRTPRCRARVLSSPSERPPGSHS